MTPAKTNVFYARTAVYSKSSDLVVMTLLLSEDSPCYVSLAHTKNSSILEILIKARVGKHGNNCHQSKTSFLRELQAQTLTDATTPIGKIQQFS